MSTSIGNPLTPQAFQGACQKLGIDAPTLWAVMAVETRGCGFQEDRQPVILFERHIFHKLTGGKFDQSHPDLSNPEAGGYGNNGAFQHLRLARAKALDEENALKSASWGLGQVMGMHAQDLGYANVQSMVQAMSRGEDEQLQALVAFVAKQPNMPKHLHAQEWAAFAERYNGSAYKKNAYDTRLEAAHARYAAGPLPDFTVRTVQLCLLYLHYAIGGVDGWFGQHTQKALTAYQSYKGLPPNGRITASTLDSLKADALS